jgi:hypothetical protein
VIIFFLKKLFKSQFHSPSHPRELQPKLPRNFLDRSTLRDGWNFLPALNFPPLNFPPLNFPPLNFPR